MDAAFDLSELLTARPGTDPGTFTIEVPDGLQQGRGAWGGVATGAMVSAAEQAEPRPGLVVRNLSAQLIAPVLVGTARIGVEVLRRGSGTTTLATRVVDDQGSVVANGVVVMGAPRAPDAIPDGPWIQPPAELGMGPEGFDVVPLGPPVAPDFVRRLELRPGAGLPFSGTGECTGWVRPADPVRSVGAPVVVALADAWWVAAMAAVARPRPVGTLGFTVDLLTDPASLPVEPDGRLRPLFHRGNLIAVRDGYCVETRELWTEDGRLVTWNTQTVALIK